MISNPGHHASQRKPDFTHGTTTSLSLAITARMAKRCWLRSEHLIRVTRPSQCLGAVRATRTNGSLRPTATGSSISMIALPARARASASHSETHQAEHSRPRPTALGTSWFPLRICMQLHRLHTAKARHRLRQALNRNRTGASRSRRGAMARKNLSTPENRKPTDTLSTLLPTQPRTALANKG